MARECASKLDALASSPESLRDEDDRRESASAILTQAKDAQVQLSLMIPNISSPAVLSELLKLNDSLTDKLQAVVSRKDFTQIVRKPSQPPSIDVSGANVIHDEPEVDEDLVALLSPRLDKGKGRAEPEPEAAEKVLSPTFAIHGDSDEEEEVEEPSDPARPRILTMGGMPAVDSEEALNGRALPTPSPTERSVYILCLA